MRIGDLRSQSISLEETNIYMLKYIKLGSGLTCRSNIVSQQNDFYNEMSDSITTNISYDNNDNQYIN